MGQTGRRKIEAEFPPALHLDHVSGLYRRIGAEGSPELKIAMIGQRGVPASFGGVERHVEELGARLAEQGHEVVVFCRHGYSEDEPTTHRGMELVHVRTVDSKHLESIVASATSTLGTIDGRLRRRPLPRRRAWPVRTVRPAPLARRSSRRSTASTVNAPSGDAWPASSSASARGSAPRCRTPRSWSRRRCRRRTASGTAARPCTSPTARPRRSPARHRPSPSVGPHEGQLRTGRRPARAGEGARAPAARVRRRARRRPPRAGRRLEPHGRVRRRSRSTGCGRPA